MSLNYFVELFYNFIHFLKIKNIDCVGGIQSHHKFLPCQYHGHVLWSENSSTRVCDVKFEICLLQMLQETFSICCFNMAAPR